MKRDNLAPKFKTSSVLPHVNTHQATLCNVPASSRSNHTAYNMEAEALFNRLIANDPDLHSLKIAPFDEEAYFPQSKNEWTRLGRCLGKNDIIADLTIAFPWDGTITPHAQFTSLGSLAPGLKSNRSIVKLTLREVVFVGFDNKSFFFSMASFFSDNLGISELHICECTLDLPCWRMLGRCIQGSNIETIIIDDTPVTPRAFDVISSSFKGSLKKLSLVNCEIHDDYINIITRHWQIDGFAPSTLDLSDNSITNCGYLSRVVPAVRNLSLARNPIGNIGVCSLLSSKRNHLHLLNLDSTGIDDTACATLQKMLENESYQVQRLSLNDNNITGNGLGTLLSALEDNTTLKSLSLSGNDILQDEWCQALTLVCNESSIDSTYFSNHTLRQLQGPSKQFYNKSSIGKKIKYMFKINLHANTTLKKKKSIARLAGATKVIVSHLSNLNQSKSTFLDGTDDVMFPYALGWLGNLTGCITLDAFYNLCLHNCNLFKLATGCRGKPNRKRQSSKKKSKSISHADREDASVNIARPNKRRMVIGN